MGVAPGPAGKAARIRSGDFAMRVALFTRCGDCPGLNAVIYAAVKKGINHYGDEFIGFLNGWRGVLDNNFIPLTLESTDGIQLKGGTILHSSRTNVKKVDRKSTRLNSSH